MQTFLDAIRAAITAETGLEDPSSAGRGTPGTGTPRSPASSTPRAMEPPQGGRRAGDRAQRAPEGITAKAAGPFSTHRRLRGSPRPSSARSPPAACYGRAARGRGAYRFLLAHRQADVVGHLRSTVIGASSSACTTRSASAPWASTTSATGVQRQAVAAVNRYGDTVDLEGDPIPSLPPLRALPRGGGVRPASSRRPQRLPRAGERGRRPVRARAPITASPSRSSTGVDRSASRERARRSTSPTSSRPSSASSPRG